MSDRGDIDDLLIDFLREAAIERKEGRTLARLFEEMALVRREIHELTKWKASVEARLSAYRSDPPPPTKPRRRLASVAEIQDDDPTAIREFKRGELARVVDRARFLDTLWKAIAAIAIVGAAVATIYASVHK